MPSLMPQMPAIWAESCAIVPSRTISSSITSSKKLCRATKPCETCQLGVGIPARMPYHKVTEAAYTALLPSCHDSEGWLESPRFLSDQRSSEHM